MQERTCKNYREGLWALSPVAVFVIAYLIVSLVIGDFYKMPLSVAMIIASGWGMLIFRDRTIGERVVIFSKEAGQENVMYMIWIFILAGAFSALAKSIGCIDATVNCALSLMPPSFIIPGIFVASCFISLAIGTSVGTVVAIVPLATQMAMMQEGGGNVALYVAAVLGGAFFGDNLSFISDTTIAATRTQGTDMRDKFRANLWIALPAALASVVLYIIINLGQGGEIAPASYNLMLVLPYIIIIVLAVLGINVMVVLSAGIFVTIMVGLYSGTSLLSIFESMGEGIDGMGNLIVVTLLAAGMLGIIKYMGGISWLLKVMTSRIKGSRGAQACIVVLTGLVNICTANNTIAIITVGELAREISRRFNVDPRKSASLLDTASCIVQCLIPYGAQMLMAATLAEISPVAAIPYLYYPFLLALMVAVSIIFKYPRRYN